MILGSCLLDVCSSAVAGTQLCCALDIYIYMYTYLFMYSSIYLFLLVFFYFHIDILIFFDMYIYIYMLEFRGAGGDAEISWSPLGPHKAKKDLCGAPWGCIFGGRAHTLVK